MRNCEGCNLCCFLGSVLSISKKIDTVCPHIDDDGKCTIYATRPSECQECECAWFQGMMADEDRPDKMNAILIVSGSSGSVLLHPTKLPDERLINFCESLKESGSCVIYYKGGKKI